MHFQLGVGVGLETFDEEEVHGGHAADQILDGRLRFLPQFAHQHPALGAHDHHFRGASLPVPEGILARPVQIEGVVGVLHGGNRQTPGPEARHQRHQQLGLAATAPAHEAEDPHGQSSFRESASSGNRKPNTGKPCWRKSRSSERAKPMRS